MAKKSSLQLIEDEKKILRMLQTNGKASIDAIAKKCGFSRQKVWRIMKKFDKEKIIWGYTAIPDERFTGTHRFTMLMKRTTKPLDEHMTKTILSERLDDLLPGKIFIEDIEYVHGFVDGIFTFHADSLITAKSFCEAFKHHFADYIDDLHLLEPIIVIRRQSLRNPNIKEDIKFL